MSTNPIWPRIRDLPEAERKPFSDWLIGQTVPLIMVDGEIAGEQDAYFPWDYENWKKGRPVTD